MPDTVAKAALAQCPYKKEPLPIIQPYGLHKISDMHKQDVPYCLPEWFPEAAGVFLAKRSYIYLLPSYPVTEKAKGWEKTIVQQHMPTVVCLLTMFRPNFISIFSNLLYCLKKLSMIGLDKFSLEGT